MNSPFNPGSGTRPPFLAGRDTEIDIIERGLDSIIAGKNANFMLTGLRGTGKTVLLKEIAKRCVKKGIFR